jgi:hypothetical protein
MDSKAVNDTPFGANKALFQSVSKVDRAYVNSGVWKCPEAPVDPTVPLQVATGSGAHHWVGMEDGTGDFYCKWCYSIRRNGKTKTRPT